MPNKATEKPKKSVGKALPPKPKTGPPAPIITQPKKPAKQPKASLIRPRDERVSKELEAFYGPQQTKELEMTVIHRFDSTGGTTLNAFQQVLYDTKQQYFAASSVAVGTGISRVTGFRLYALAAYDYTVAPADATLTVLYDLPVCLGETGAATSQRTTKLLPLMDPKMVLVGQWKAKGVFGDSSVEPVENATFNTVLGTVAVYDSDMALHSTRIVQFEAHIDVLAALPVLSTSKMSVVAGNTAVAFTTALPGDTVDTVCLIQMRKIRDST